MATNREFNLRIHRESLKRTARILRLREQGKTWAEIAQIMKISRQRAYQLGTKVPMVA